ncbi:hypothetical protein FB45DRAFT_949496 [Roridomyces roridus]|uniref:F-box domain-containing protein n=1 Tax=Roridomyces roridus TaxID=1738132 RepID=A0AAD7B0J5_9AGAR|nr:hypothetical protein FB45DRAFT_949496 [Roridomyces roridus]
MEPHILSFPNEITAEIFTHFLPPYPDRPSVVGPLSPSFLLGICRQWYDLDIQVDDDELHAQQHHLLQLWLQRSGNCPLSIELRNFESGSLRRRSHPLMPAFLETMLCHASRWQDMHIFMPYENLRQLEASVSMPLLRSLTFGPDNLHRMTDDTPERPMHLFTQAPQLKAVVLSHSFNPFCITLPWSQITTLEAVLFDDQFFEILRQAQALESCTLWLNSQDFESPNLPTIPTLSRLRYLKVEGGTKEWAFFLQGFLRRLGTLPALESLHISEMFLGPDPVDAICSLRPRGYPREIEIWQACASLDVYRGAFPEAQLAISA